MVQRAEGGVVQPAYVPSHPELNGSSIGLGIVMGVVMTASFAYIALKLGFVMPGSTVAAIAGFALLSARGRRGGILANNLNQTIASGINTASAGVTFTIPALFLMGELQADSYGAVLPLALAGIAGSLLGVVLIVPLRRHMIEWERLRFPSGVAVASLLQSPGFGRKQGKLLLLGFGIATGVHMMVRVFGLSETIDLGAWMGLPAYAPLSLAISFAPLGAGLLSGRGGLPLFFGGAFAWWLVAPVVVEFGWIPPSSHGSHIAQSIYVSMLRPLGVGLLIGGAVAGTLASVPTVWLRLRQLMRVRRVVSSDLLSVSPNSVYRSDLSSAWLWGAFVMALVLMAASAMLGVSDLSIGFGLALLGLALGWAAIAGVLVARSTGMTDISPVSGMNLIGVGLVWVLSGDMMLAAIFGVVTSVCMAQCADMMSDLRAGHLLGASPFKQQAAQLGLSWIGPLVGLLTVWLLWVYGDGFGPGRALAAPQASALVDMLSGAGLSASSSGFASLPIETYLCGGLIGLASGLIPVSGFGILLGLSMYLPLSLTCTYGLGCLIREAVHRIEASHDLKATVVPIAAGFIVGEALTSLAAVFVQIVVG